MQPQPLPPPFERRHGMSLGVLYLIVFAVATALFVLASLGSEADPIGSILAGAVVAAIVIAVVAIVRRVTR